MRSWFTGFSVTAMAALCAPGLSGCARGPETDYGSSRGKSLNGTSVFASMLRDERHEVRAAIRLTDELAEWAEGIVRFAPYPGPPSRDEATWYRDWLAADTDRWLIYVVGDFDATSEYWREIVSQLPSTADPERRTEGEEARDKAAQWTEHLPPKAKDTGDAKVWFNVDSAWDPPRVLKKLIGPWATGIDAGVAGLTAHEPLQKSEGRVLLMGDDKPFVLEKTVAGYGRLLVIANGSFLLNEPLVNSARRALAERVIEWAKDDGRPIALVEGSFVMGGPRGPKSLWELILEIPDLRWVALQLCLAGLLAALARAPRLGRPKPDPPSEADHPAAHARALGVLLARAGSTQEARDLLDRYRRWRYPRTRENATPPPRTIPVTGEATPSPLSPQRNAPNG